MEDAMSVKNLCRAWSSVMDESENPLQNYSLSTAHMVMQLLAWMWSAVFSIAIGSYLAFRITAVAHVVLIGALFITCWCFRMLRAINRLSDSLHCSSCAIGLGHLES